MTEERLQSLGGIFLLILAAFVLGLGVNDRLSLPIVQKDSATREVVGVITSDGVEHSASYFYEHKLEKGTYDIEWVRPLSMKE